MYVLLQQFSIWGLQTERSSLGACSGLNDFVPPKSICWNPNPKCNGLRRWGLWEVTGLWRQSPVNRSVSTRVPENCLAFSLPGKDTVRKTVTCCPVMGSHHIPPAPASSSQPLECVNFSHLSASPSLEYLLEQPEQTKMQPSWELSVAASPALLGSAPWPQPTC